MRSASGHHASIRDDRSHMHTDKDETEIIHDVLVAVVNGPFCVDGEFQTITGVHLHQVEALLKTWPAYRGEQEPLVVWVVEACLGAVLEYPNTLREEAWPHWLSVSPDTVERIRNKWRRRRNRVGSPFQP